jgi:hypothetical protein
MVSLKPLIFLASEHSQILADKSIFLFLPVPELNVESDVSMLTCDANFEVFSKYSMREGWRACKKHTRV